MGHCVMNTDYYIQCPGAQVTQGERHFIKHCAEQYGPTSTFVNIGVMWGCTVHCLRAGNPTATIYALDIKYSWKIKYKDDIDVHWLTGDSRTYNWQNGPIDLLLIDGDHHYATVSKDIANWTPHVPVNGTVLFHDYRPSDHNLHQFPELADVKKAVRGWKSDKWAKIDLVSSMIGFKRVR